MTRATDRTTRCAACIWLFVLAVFAASILVGCAAPTRPEAPQIKPAPNATDPAKWESLYPVQYAQWFATSQARPAGKSGYKRGFDDGYTYDKLSEFPFMPVLFKGWGFGIEYNEPRGHWWMLRDQQEIDQSRVKAGGACLTCKSPSADALHTQYGEKMMSMPYQEAVNLLPEGERQLGVSCIDCHDTETLALRSPRWTVKNALKAIGLPEPNAQQQRIIACGQCHATYSVMKRDGQSVDVNLPWEGGAWGDISIEDIVANLKTDPARQEWVQDVTGFKVGFIRHPDVEFFTDSSVHFNAGVACPDCHMPYTVVDGVKTSDHDVMSPLKRDLRACIKCHPEDAAELKAQVLKIQDRNASMLIDTGYTVAANAKLFQLVNSRIATTSPEIKPEYERAKSHYLEAFYRLVYMGAENSMGFHNPSEGGRILRDAMAYSQRSDAILRQLCARNGVTVPEEIDLQLGTYLTGRGTNKLGFVKDQLVPDPFSTNVSLWPQNRAALGKVAVQAPQRSQTASQALAEESMAK